MLIQVNSDNIINAGADTVEAIEAHLRERLARYEERLSRIEVHLKDINGATSDLGADKRCTIEARPNGRDPVAVSADGETVDAAASAAATRLLTALEREFGRITVRKGH